MSVLDDEERLIEKPSNGAEGSEHEPTKDAERSDTGSLLLLPENRQAEDDMVVDPECTVDGRADEHSTSSPAVDVVEPLIAVARTEEKG